MSFIAVVIFPYTPRIIRTKEPEMPGKRNAVKASSPAKTRRNELLKSNTTKDKAITIAINNPKKKSKIYFNEDKLDKYLNLKLTDQSQLFFVY